MDIDLRKTYRIEFRSYNIGAGRVPISGAGTGFAHNFIAIVEVQADGTGRLVGELHGLPQDRASGQFRDFDVLGKSRLAALSRVPSRLLGGYYGDSLNHPAFVLYQGSGAEVRRRLDRAAATADWINRQDFDYDLTGRNSNSVVFTIARSMGFDVTGQPIDRMTGRHLPAPGGTVDLRDQRPGAPPGFAGPMRRVTGYGDTDRAPATVPEPADPKRRGALPFGFDPAGLTFGHEAALALRRAHGVDPGALAGGPRTPEQKAIIARWVADTLAPAVAHGRLPAPLGDDLVIRAARTSPSLAARALQEGLNRFGRPSVAVDGSIGPETLDAAASRMAEHGLAPVRGAVALAGFKRDIDGLARGEIPAAAAPALFDDAIGRLFAAAPRPRSGRPEVRTVQRAINETDGIFGHLEAPLAVDGDFGPKTGAALIATGKAAGAERVTDHLGKRLGIGEPALGPDHWRGFDHALGTGAADPADRAAIGQSSAAGARRNRAADDDDDTFDGWGDLR